MLASILSISAFAAAVTAKIIPIDVGNGGIVFSPNSTTADVGDMLEFHFYPETGPHSVVEGMFNSPCMPAPDAFFSNYINGSSSGNETYTIAVTSTDPIWYYCSARMHCNNGMVGVINPPSNMTIDMFAAAAKNVASNVAPASTMVSGTYTTMPATMTTGSSSMGGSSSMSMTGSSTRTSSSGAGAATGSTTSTAGGAKKTAGIVGLMAAGGLAALMV